MGGSLGPFELLLEVVSPNNFSAPPPLAGQQCVVCDLLSLPLGPCRDAVHTMLDADIAGAPVVNKSGQIIGVLTEADIIWKVGQCLFWPEGSCTPTAVLLLTI